MLRKLRFLAVFMGLLLGGIAPPASAVLIIDLDTNFSNATTPAGPAPWLRATFLQNGANNVRLTMDSLLIDPREFVDGNQGWYFNLDPNLDPAQLVFTFVSATNFAGSVAINTGIDFTNADGGGLYDIQFDFPAGPPAQRFGVGAQLVYDISLAGLVEQSFNYLSSESQNAGNGTFRSAAHVQGIQSGAGSSHIGDGDGGGIQQIPEPGILLLFGIGLVGMGVAWRRRRA